ncbi:Serine/threonine-protein kinase PknB [Posidoniimonas corsicana]|uniref:non-specific serine/threonine protein kinase n=1 Tax=Posidoniimonas corsicana TaxID=1938618 RepID=A0A5C5VCQ3_9BACT|nr:serine/threonine-protein kinase [Posidoniimonas corsicana]TWT35415.1 Serine/threonine-protein kinase PknB [Posidoniimonas corsicana]
MSSSQSQFENAETIDASPPAGRTSTREAVRQTARRMVALVEGSSPHLSSETRDILRSRLRTVAAIFFCVFSAFLTRWLVLGIDSEHRWLFITHTLVTVLMGVLWSYLTWGQGFTLTRLRIAELLVFGDPALFFLVLSQQKLHHMANLPEGGHLPVILVPWTMLIFTYAIFIPNSWRRAFAVIGPMGLAPIAVILMQRFACPGFQHCVKLPEFENYATEQALLMIAMVAIGVIGVHTINTLRLQAFEAKRLGQYVLRRKLGSGGMGEVYLAEHQMMKRPCAVKIIRPEKAGDPLTLARFEREVRSTAKLSHWNSIDIYDYGSTPDGTFYYVMEYLPGHNIGELVDEYGPLPPERCVYLIEQVCKALAEAHNTGLVHRDIKPANIFCAYRGGEFDVAKLLDFGLAKPSFSGADATLTQEGAITGSPMFMSPEQATGEREADARSDIYSLGCVLYYLLSGRYPFPYKQSVKVIVAHASEQPDSLREVKPEISEALNEVVMRCLEKDPEDRFQTVEQLRRALLDLPVASRWSSEKAAEWWSCHGCPERKAMAAALVEAAAEGAACAWPASQSQAVPEAGAV